MPLPRILRAIAVLLSACSAIPAFSTAFAYGGGAPGTNAPSGGVLSLKGIPEIDYNTDNGFYYGADLSIFYYSTDTNRYDWQLLMIVRLSTDFRSPVTSAEPSIDLDVPRLGLFGADCRFHATLKLDYLPYYRYYSPGNDDTSTRYSLYEDTNYYYYCQDFKPALLISLALPLLATNAVSRNELDLVFGMNSEYDGITNSPRLPADNGTPRIYTDLPLGVNGGFAYSFLAGAVFDNRDFAPNPRSGTYAEAVLEGSLKALGSGYDYGRITLINSFYLEPVPGFDRLVFAGRSILDCLFGAPPFYVMQYTGGLNPFMAIGSSMTMRGIPDMRYTGKVKLVLTPELRLRVLDFPVTIPPFEDTWHLELTLFSDIGNVWDDIPSVNAVLQYTYGAGFKLGWGEDFIISFDFAFWRAAFGNFYLELGEHF